MNDNEPKILDELDAWIKENRYKEEVAANIEVGDYVQEKYNPFVPGSQRSEGVVLKVIDGSLVKFAKTGKDAIYTSILNLEIVTKASSDANLA